VMWRQCVGLYTWPVFGHGRVWKFEIRAGRFEIPYNLYVLLKRHEYELSRFEERRNSDRIFITGLYSSEVKT